MKRCVTVSILTVDIDTELIQLLKCLWEIVGAGLVHQVVALIRDSLIIRIGTDETSHGLNTATLNGKLQRGAVVQINYIKIRRRDSVQQGLKIRVWKQNVETRVSETKL